MGYQVSLIYGVADKLGKIPLLWESSKIYGVPKRCWLLLVSLSPLRYLCVVTILDGFNLSLPFPNRPAEDFAPWPHVDQSPLVKGLHCVQGIMNLTPNGPDDGGLMVSQTISKADE